MRRRILGCFVLLFLLCGCQVGKEPLSTPSPTIPPAPTPVMTAVPTPAPTPSEEGRLKSGEDVSLWLSPKVTSFEDLKEYTSYALLQTPPERVSRYARRHTGKISIEMFIPDDYGGPSAVLIFDENGAEQEFSLELDLGYGAIGELLSEDLNFDGIEDLRVYIGGNRGGQMYYAAFLKEQETQKYVYAPSFSHISNPKFDYEHQTIWGGCDFLYGYYYDAWEFIDGEFINTHSLIGDYANWAQGTGQQCTEYAWINGTEVEVGKREFPGEAPSSAVAAYIDSGPVWEGWAWCDPHAYEMKG